MEDGCSLAYPCWLPCRANRVVDLYSLATAVMCTTAQHHLFSSRHVLDAACLALLIVAVLQSSP